MKNLIVLANTGFTNGAIATGTRTLAKRILRFARNNLNNRVYASGVKNARGECWDLAYEALQTAGAKTPYDYGTNAYYWSSKRVPMSRSKPGDVLQYRNFIVRIEQEDGSWEEYEIGLPHHTAILKSKLGNGQVEVFEQNMNGTKTVHTNTYYLVSGSYSGSTVTIKSGSCRIYRPLKKVRQTTLLVPSSRNSSFHARKNHFQRQLANFPNIYV